MTSAPFHTTIGGESFVLARDLMAELTGSVPTLGGHAVVVGFGGTQAFCDKTLSYVNIPALPEVERIPLDVARQIRGFAAHEAAHLAFTDPHVAIVRRDGTQDALLHTLWNCVEDYMIERFWLELYPGAVKNFAATETWCSEQYLQAYAKNPHQVYDLRQVGGIALTWMRALYFGLGTTVSRTCLDTLPSDLRARVESWFRTLVLPAETTQECLEVAWILYDDIMANPLSAHTPPAVQKQLAKGAPPTQGQSGTGTTAPGMGPSGQGQPQPGPSGGTPQPGHPQGTQPGPETGSSLPAGTTAGPPQPGTAAPHAPLPNGHSPGLGVPRGPGAATGTPTLSPIPAAALGPVAPYPVGFDLGAALSSKGIKASTQPLNAPVISAPGTGPAGAALAPLHGQAKAEQSLIGLESAVGQTATELRRALKAISKDRWKTGRLDGVIDSRRMAFAATGSLEYHRKKVQGQAIDTAVSILIDCSQSMDGAEIQICQQMAVILERALMGTPIAHEILGYTTADPGDIDSALKTAQKAHAARREGLRIQPTGLYVFRPFGARHTDAMNSLGAMTQVPMGGTPTSQGLLMAHDRLARRPERRHVIIVLTDGASDDKTRTRAAADAIERCGVTVLGIGIGTTSVAREFAKHATISKAEELPALMISTLTDMLLGERRKRGMNSAQVRTARALA